MNDWAWVIIGYILAFGALLGYLHFLRSTEARVRRESDLRGADRL